MHGEIRKRGRRAILNSLQGAGPHFVPDGGLRYYFELGVRATIIQQALEDVRRQTGLNFQGYRDLTVAEVSQVTVAVLSVTL